VTWIKCRSADASVPGTGNLASKRWHIAATLVQGSLIGRVDCRPGWAHTPLQLTLNHGGEAAGFSLGATTARRGMNAMTTSTTVIRANAMLSGVETKIERSPSEIASAWRTERSKIAAQHIGEDHDAQVEAWRRRK
jgi:hypothetical protein